MLSHTVKGHLGQDSCNKKDIVVIAQSSIFKADLVYVYLCMYVHL